MKWFALFLSVFVLSSNPAKGCGTHVCVGVDVDVNAGGMYPGYYYGGRPYAVGNGSVAFNRGARMAYRSNRAAAYGFPVRAARLDARSQAAFNRSAYRSRYY